MDPGRLRRAANKNSEVADKLVEKAGEIGDAFEAMQAELDSLHPDRWVGRAWNDFDVVWNDAVGQKRRYVGLLTSIAGQLRRVAGCLEQKAAEEEERRRAAIAGGVF